LCLCLQLQSRVAGVLFYYFKLRVYSEQVVFKYYVVDYNITLKP
jgi:hypothetical protein